RYIKRHIDNNHGLERSPIVETEAASAVRKTSIGRRSGASCRARFASTSAQRFLLAASLLAAPGDHRLGGGVPCSGHLPVEGTRRGWRARILRAQSCGDVAAVRNHYGQSSQGREACRRAGRATHEVRVGGERKDRKGLGLVIPPAVLLRADEVVE